MDHRASTVLDSWTRGNRPLDWIPTLESFILNNIFTLRGLGTGPTARFLVTSPHIEHDAIVSRPYGD